MVGSTGKRYGEEFKLMILEMHKKVKTTSQPREKIFPSQGLKFDIMCFGIGI